MDAHLCLLFESSLPLMTSSISSCYSGLSFTMAVFPESSFPSSLPSFPSLLPSLLATRAEREFLRESVVEGKVVGGATT